MYKFFLVVHAMIAASMVGVILMQRSEGGGLAGGGSPAGLMSARGAADFLTRTTTILATLFVGLSILLAAMAVTEKAPSEIEQLPVTGPATVPAMPSSSVPMAGTGPGTPIVPADVTTAPAPASTTTTLAEQTPAAAKVAPVAKPEVKIQPGSVKPVAEKKPAVREAKPVSAAKVSPPPMAPAPVTPAPAPATATPEPAKAPQ